jgi:hypothetical protein
MGEQTMNIIGIPFYHCKIVNHLKIIGTDLMFLISKWYQSNVFISLEEECFFFYLLN